jgi:hypothetical protein
MSWTSDWSAMNFNQDRAVMPAEAGIQYAAALTI